jgi:hypothetical protein
MQPCGPGVRQLQLLASAVRPPFRDSYEAFALQRLNVSPERRAIHHHIFGQSIDRNRPQALKHGED